VLEQISTGTTGKTKKWRYFQMKKLLKNVLLAVCVFVIFVMIMTGCDQGTNDNKTYQAETTTAAEITAAETTTAVETTASVSETGRPEFIKNETDSEITIVDPIGNEVTLPKNPKRVIALYASYRDLWYEAGGEVIASVSSKSFPVPEGVEDLGSMSKVSPEIILALQPELVIMADSMDSQIALKDILEENKIPYLYVRYNLYQHYIDNLDLMSRLNGTQEQTAGKIKAIADGVNTIIEKVKEKKAPSVLIMFSTSKSVSCEATTGITGNMVELLGGINIVGEIPIEGETRVDFSMESIAVGDPDIILIKTMGDVEDCKQLIQKEIESNEAWAAMRAVKEGKVYYLDKDLFLSKPNERFLEAFEILSGYLYQENLGDMQ
jgi:iron complex transport system substrate-binding protein